MKFPLPWARAFRRKVKLKKEEERLASEYLRQVGWKEGRDGYGQYWSDPLDNAPWILTTAIRIQATRDAQKILEPLGWRLTSGCWVGAVAKIWASAYSVSKGRRHCSITTAMKLEGLLP